MSAVVNALSSFASWLMSLATKAFGAIWDLLTDLLINALDLFLTALSSLIIAIPAPDFLAGHALQDVFAQMSGDVLFFMSAFNVGPGIALLGSGFAFRMVRKVVTLFQW